MRDEIERPAVRSRINSLQVLLCDALTIEAKLIGEEPEGDAKAGPPADFVLDTIESSLELAISRAEIVVKRLIQIEKRL